MDNSCTYLNEDGSPKLSLLIETFTRSGPALAGGTDWMDNIRFCRWNGQWDDGRKHDRKGDPQGGALPWDGASDCRPYVADDIINEGAAMLTAAFWRSMVQPGSANGEAEAYAVALVEHLVFSRITGRLLDEVELSANYMLHYGWCVLAPRWRRELGLKHFELKWDQIAQGAAAAQQAVQQAQAQGQPVDPQLQGLAQLPVLITDPLLEEAAIEFLRGYYDDYVQKQVPEDLRDRVPKITVAQARKVVRDLRLSRTAKTALPYLCVNEPEISALKPWDEVYLPPELTTENEIVFQVERLSDATLRARELTENYDPAWVKLALTKKGQWTSSNLPVGEARGVAGSLASGNAAPLPAPSSESQDGKTGPIELVHAIYKGVDEWGVPAVYCTTFHRDIAADQRGNALVAKHELVEGVVGDLPYTVLTRERWNRSVTSSRSVPEMVHTQQNLVKGFLDSLIDRASITVLPPVNVYESPMDTDYHFGPARKNYCRPGREPQFMQMPAGTGMVDGLQVHNVVRESVDNRFGMLSENVPAARQQTAQEKLVRRFLMSWTKALQQVLAFYQKHGDDAEFARITGADTGWLEARRNVPNLLAGVLEFDVRELDSELNMKRIETFNTVALPNDINGIYDRVAWAQDMARGILGPRASKRLVRNEATASEALKEKAALQVLKMFAGDMPTFLDDKDPTAAPLLQFTQQIVMQNPNYLKALTDEALVALAGQQAQMVAQQLGQSRRPDERFSALLMKWLENLKFIGVTQVQNRQIGRTGVDANAV